MIVSVRSKRPEWEGQMTLRLMGYGKSKQTSLEIPARLEMTSETKIQILEKYMALRGKR